MDESGDFSRAIQGLELLAWIEDARKSIDSAAD